MGGRAAFLRVGLLIVLGAAGILAIPLFLAGDRLRQGQAYESYFTESVQGLEVGSPVKFRGVTLGRVGEIGLVSAEYGRGPTAELNAENYRQVFVRYTLDRDRAGHLPDPATAARTGLRARLATQGITGLVYIELDFADPAQFPARNVPWQPKAPVMPSMPSTLSRVQDAAQQFLAELNKVDLSRLSEQITGLIEDIRTELRSGNVHDALQRAAGLMQKLQSDVERADIPALVHEAQATASAAKDLLSTTRQAVEQANIPAVAEDTRATMQAANRAAERLAQALSLAQTTIRHIGDGTTDIMQALTPILRDIRSAAANVRETSEALRQYPAGAILGGPPPRGAERPPERSR